MLLYFIIIRFIKDDGWKMILLSFVSLLLYLVRPEFIVAFVFSFFVSIYFNKNNKIRWLLLLLFLLILIYIGKQTTIVDGLDRGFFAFAQHYAITYKIWHRNIHFSFNDYVDILPKIFGKSQTLIGSILYNPLETLRHIATAIGFYIFAFFKNTEDFLLPSFWFKYLGKFKHVIFILIIILALLLYIRKNLWKKNFDDKIFTLSLITFYIAGVIPNFIIGYKPHYFQLHFILYVLFFSVLFFKNIDFNFKTWQLLILFFFFYIVTPKINSYKLIEVDFEESKNLPVQKLATYINTTNDNKSHVLLAFQTNLHYAFEGNNFSGFDAFSIHKPFLEFIAFNKVDYIYINQQILKDEKLVNDKGWNLFIKNPEEYGFQKIELAGTKNYLLQKTI